MVALSPSLSSLFPSPFFGWSASVSAPAFQQSPRPEASRPVAADSDVVTRKDWEMPQKAWVKPQKENRSFVDEAAAAIRSFAGSPEIGDRTKRLIEKAARHAGTTYSQAFDLWYRKASPKAAELFVRRVSNRAAEAVAGLSSEGFRGEDDARSEIENLKARIAQLEARVALAVQASASPVPFVGRPLAPEDSRTA